MARPKLKAEKRKVLGRKVKNLRKEGVLPANMYGKDIKSKTLKTDTESFRKVYRNVGETGLVDLVIGKKKHPVLVQNVQTDPVTDAPLHADFYQVNLKEKVAAQVPIEIIGDAPAEKEGLGTVVQYINEIEVEALPTDLPEKFEIDISALKEVDQAVQVKDLGVDKKVEVQNEEDQIIVKVEPPREEEEPELVSEPEEGLEEGEEVKEAEGEDEGDTEAESNQESGKESKEEKKEG